MKRKKTMKSNTFQKNIQYSLEDVNFKNMREEYIAIEVSAKLFNDRLKKLKKEIKENIADYSNDFYITDADIKEHVVKSHVRSTLHLVKK
jgi:hypothetical protein